MPDALDPALAVEADIVVGGEIVALAGHRPCRRRGRRGSWPGGRSSRRPERRRRHKRRPGSPCRRTRRPSGGPRPSRRRCCRPSKAGDQMLDFARMLGRADDMELARLARRGERGLAFEVEMLLPAHFERCPAGGAARRRARPAASPRAMSCGGSSSESGVRASAMVTRAGSGSVVDLAPAARRRARRDCWSRRRRTAAGRDRGSRPRRRAGRRGRPGRHCSRRGCRRR